MTQLAELTAAVAAQNTVVASTVALLGGLVDRLQSAAHALARGDGGADLTRVIHSIQSNTAELSAALIAGTPAAAAEAPTEPEALVESDAEIPEAFATLLDEVPPSTVAATLSAAGLDAVE